MLRMGWHGILTGTSLMKNDIDQTAAEKFLKSAPLVELLPHHHSNFHNRRHSHDNNVQSGREVVVGIAGDCSQTLVGTVTTCLSDNNFSNVAVVDGRALRYKTVIGSKRAWRLFCYKDVSV